MKKEFVFGIVVPVAQLVLATVVGVQVFRKSMASGNKTYVEPDIDEDELDAILDAEEA